MIDTDKESLLIGLISDTHIPSRTDQIPPQILEDFKEREIDYLFHLGDFTTMEAYKRLQNDFGEDKMIGILGNMDDGKLKDILPETRELELYGKKIFMVHGMGGPNIIIKRLNKHYDLSPYDIIIFGHVHRPYNEVWKDGKLYLNPGTPTDKRFTDINSYGFLRISEKEVNPEIIEL